jgi:hypothetical protein
MYIATKTNIMMKFYLLILLVLLSSIDGFSQSYEGTVQFDKKKQPAIVIDYYYPSEAVENAFIKRMEQLGFKAKEEKGILNRDKGFIVFKNAYITDISKDRLDYIIKVERKSRKESEASTLYLIMQKDGDNAIEKIDAYDVGQAKAYLNQLIPDIEAANLELQIKAQEEVVAKAEKKLKNLQDDKLELEKKLAANEKAQEETIKDIQNQKQALGNLQGKRRE